MGARLIDPSCCDNFFRVRGWGGGRGVEESRPIFGRWKQAGSKAGELRDVEVRLSQATSRDDGKQAIEKCLDKGQRVVASS